MDPFGELLGLPYDGGSGALIAGGVAFIAGLGAGSALSAFHSPPVAIGRRALAQALLIAWVGILYRVSLALAATIGGTLPLEVAAIQVGLWLVFSAGVGAGSYISYHVRRIT